MQSESKHEGGSATDSGNGHSILNQAVILSGCCQEEEELTRCKQGTHSEYGLPLPRDNVAITPWLFESRQSPARSEDEFVDSVPA